MKSKKIKSLKELQKIVKNLKIRKKKIVFTNGCFDILHAGHLYVLEKAKKTGDVLIVGLNSDESVRKLKGNNRPIMSEKDRAYLLSGLSCVDYCVIFNEETPAQIIQAIKPDVLVKGADYKHGEIVGEDVVKANRGKVLRIPLLKGKSTTNIITKIHENQ
ncbi:MAG TPA: D-glycero-beta-D-manno-heptose 1-phosphate adenylyltransferase [bacterium]|nr:D-glycero-beta-D-manno-heptose 1-phosphate adenylyltransferase [bacterium]HOL49930.1 D-glycero-beta-D-manno-heptose 1-phosphate adenylyltransferase [bacterium]HPO51636.1 D-glycero-beta-D-manno-heptose 1-phosphate adenylyltransferase [bacterium]HXK44975.1 D-glycero-beta-D-manno-heptose 1-phosphate adenylyltransferase [bacterium]